MYSKETAVMKAQLISPLGAQVTFWKNVYPTLEGDIDTEYLEGIHSLPLGEDASFFYDFALPKFENVFGNNQPSIFMDLRMLELLRTRFCPDAEFTFFNDCLLSGKILLEESIGYEYFYSAGNRQRGNFNVFRGQLGHTRPYHKEKYNPTPLKPGEFFPPVGIVAAILCSQLGAIWSLDKKWWIACSGSGTKTGYGEDKGGDSIPCLEYCHDLCGAKNSVSVIPLKVLFDSEGLHRENEGGLASAVALI